MTPPQLPLETVKTLQTLRLSGTTVAAIHAQTGLSTSTIIKYTKRLSPRAVFSPGPSERVMDLLAEHGSLSALELKTSLKCNRSSIYNLLRRLMDEGVLERFQLYSAADKRKMFYYRLLRSELGRVG